MKKYKSFLTLIFLWCLNQTLVNAQTIKPIERSIGQLHISVDPRMELITTVQMLSEYPFIKRNYPYSQDVLDYFQPFSSEEAITITNSLMNNYGFGADAPVGFMLHLSQPPELETQHEISDDLLERSGKSGNLEQYRRAMQQFAKTSNFDSFWNSKIPFYNQIIDTIITEIGEKDMVKILEDFLNETQESYHLIIAHTFAGGFAHRIPGNTGKYHVYACLFTHLKDNKPYLDFNIIADFLWHEFSHSFVNPLTEKYADKVASLDQLFEPIKEQMSKQFYPEWESCLNEHIVRAITVRLAQLHLGAKQSKELLDSEISQHYIYIEPLIEKLKEFENQRDKNKITFTEYYPELLNMLESLQK